LGDTSKGKLKLKIRAALVTPAMADLRAELRIEQNRINANVLLWRKMTPAERLIAGCRVMTYK